MGHRGPKPQSAVVAIAKRIAISDHGCWEWPGSIMPNGYGKVGFRGKTLLAHRLAYETFVGPIPDGLQIDHLCRNRRCVRPGHLEPVTGRVNVLRGEAPTAENARKTHCPKGHELSGDNLLPAQLARGGRECRTCHNERMVVHGRRYKARKALLAGFLWSLIWPLPGCASLPRTAQTVIAPPADTSWILALIGVGTISHGCAIGPDKMLTAAHVWDKSPTDPNSIMLGATFSTPAGASGAIIPTGAEGAWDIGYGVPLEPFDRWYNVAAEAPKPGEKLWLNSWDFGSKETAFSEPTLEITVSRLAAGYIIAHESIPQGTSGSCVLNARNEVVAVVSFGKYVGTPSSNQEVSAIVSVWGPWLGRMEAYGAKLKALRKEAQEKAQREQMEALIGGVQ